MAFLDFTDSVWQGETGGLSRILVGEQRFFKYDASVAADVIDGTRLADATNAGLYPYQIALNPDSDVGLQPTFIPNPALTGNLTASPGVPGRENVVGTLYLPFTGDGNAVYIRNILQSKGVSNPVAITDTIIRTPASPVGDLTPLVVAAGTDLTESSITVGDISSHTGTHPARLKVTLAGFSSSDVAAGGFGVITFVGPDYNDDTITTEVFVSAGSAATAEFDVPHFWKEVTSVTTRGFLSAGSGTFSVTASDTSQVVTFKPYDLAMSSYLSLEFDQGTVPLTLRGLYATAARIEVPEDNNTLMQLVIELSGRSGAEYENLAGTQVPEVTQANKQTVLDTDYRTDISGLSGLEIISEDVMSAAEVVLTIGTADIRLPVINTAFDFGIQAAQSPVKTGDPKIGSAPYMRQRQPLLTGELHYSKLSNLSVAVLNNIQQDFVKLTFSKNARGGFPWEHELTFRKGQFQSFGRTVTDDLIRERFTLLGLPSRQGVVDDITWKSTFSRYHDVMNY